ncbi:hypothetical protein GPECTOR_1g488 [Gonium pectorale]|uniref:PHD-type domain-containing protein n=1 Tax=Gonium pectorale TaxID=33097 RepID=A0A150H3D9_GONPE|nr:hypothetical protein GPECTOR_1g488 [Gonium pectorale]|eukprot:KXZ56543.1 hypothetical protein GPECTOR_1g488 [Gonium pectorale]
MEAAAAPEPTAKRQRKEPGWKAAFVDPHKVKELKNGTVVHLDVGTGQHPSTTSSPGAITVEEKAEVLDTRILDNSHVELLIMHKGRRYRGVVERIAMPQGVGVSTRVTREELDAIAVAPPHGENPSNMCALCNTALEVSPVQGISDEKAGVYVKVRITANWTARVHLQCAVWCPEVKEDPFVPGYYHHLGPAVRRGRALRCRTCKERGATVGCFQEGCPSVYHLTCAVNCGCAFNERTMEVWCPMHLR